MKYLLEAEDAKMQAWKDRAKLEGVSFAVWLRRAADQQLGGEAGTRVVRPHLDSPGATHVAVGASRPESLPVSFVPVAPRNAQGSLVRGGKRSYEPDPR